MLSIRICLVAKALNRVPFDTPAALAMLAVETPTPSSRNSEVAAAMICDLRSVMKVI
jgi:uncharacterized protein YdiU (UPF0061 family)